MPKYGDTVTLRLSDMTEISAEISYTSLQENGDIMIIFKISKGVEKLILYRKISLDVIWWSASGLKVPNDALIKENDIYYVIRNRVGYKDKIYVKILRQNENYAIIESYKVQELVELGYAEEEVSNMKSINLYDELTVENNR